MFVFGGYNPALFTRTKYKDFPFTYYGDTFMYCPSERMPSGVPTVPKWKQVLTRGFPTYRAQSQLHTDPATGKMYLFGGYVNTDAVPSRKDYISRTFGDVWELRVDLPGGHFEDVDLADEAKTARAGPWQRCLRADRRGGGRNVEVCSIMCFVCGMCALKWLIGVCRILWREGIFL